MDTFYNRFNEKIKGIITGFDRIVFKGMIRPIMFAGGMQYHLMSRGVLNKDFKSYVQTQSQAIIETADEISERLCGNKSIYISSSNDRKETLAHNRQKETGVKEGLIGVWSCVEACNTFHSTFNDGGTYPILKHKQSRCKHLYFYFDDPVYGFMSIRLQTWAPYEIQIALNGREWLRRSLDEYGCGYILSGNKFLHIDDYDLAQELLDKQRNADFENILNRFLPSVFPLMPKILGEEKSYYWTLWQSELAKDYIFESGDSLKPLMDDFMLHAMISGTGERILKYFGSPVKSDGQPHPKSNLEILSRSIKWFNGIRVRHWNEKNSVKFYNEHNVLRFEMTMNNPAKFKIHRHVEGQDKSEPKRFIPMRKGIADISVRAAVSHDIVNRFTEQMSSVKNKTPLREVLNPVIKPLIRNGKKIRSLDVFGKDLDLLCAISDPVFNVSGITNKQLQKILQKTAWAKKMSGKQLSGRISRHLRLLRDHGLIKKYKNQNKYYLSDSGQKFTAAINAALTSSVDELLKSAVA